MASTSQESRLFESICRLVIESDIAPNVTRLEWMSDLLYMHKRRWLYCSMKGSRLVAIAAAYCIPEWNEHYLISMPEKEEGRILYIPFVVSSEEVPVAPLRLIRFCLRENPDVEEIIYLKKRWNPSQQKSFGLKRWMLKKPMKQGVAKLSFLAAT